MIEWFARILGKRFVPYTIEVFDRMYVAVVFKRMAAVRDFMPVEIKQAVFDLIDQGERRFLFDLRRIRRTNGFCLEQLVYSFRKINESGGKAVLVLGRNRVLDMVLKAELDRVFKVETDLGKAVTYLTHK